MYGKFNTYEELENEVKKYEKEKRFNHSLGVVKVSMELAKLNNYDVEKARVCAILHDCAKNLDDDFVNEFCKEYKLDFTYLKDYHNLLHSHLGYYFAKYHFGIEDEEILNAIKYHTSGKAEMTLLEKIIFIADFLDPGRDTSEYQETYNSVKEATYRNIDEGLVKLIDRQLNYLKVKEKDIYIDTYKAYEFYVK
ncbi:MAG: bis(5'-nucleosyl)-tetraphosphatase (symmetrical) YqeK [Clostridia bacterium]|nr:bis(5'-nucleosyl)-tetraphosphatase (symmetrical) YqeK [Clostridia bacterium]